MDKLIEALTLFRKYGNPKHPTWCEHDVLHVDIDSSAVSILDKRKLSELGFTPNSEGGFLSFYFGSC